MLTAMGHTAAVEALLDGGEAIPAVLHEHADMLARAINCSEPGIAQLLLQHGAPITARAVRAAAAWRSLPQPSMLRLLIAAGPLPEPEAMHSTAFDWTCPILARLRQSALRTWGVSTWKKLAFHGHAHALHRPASSATKRVVCVRLFRTHTSHAASHPMQRDPEGDALFRRAAADCMELFAEAGGCLKLHA